MITTPPTVTRLRGFDWTYAVSGCRVDLAAYLGNGSCDCAAFTQVALPCLEAGARPSDATRCVHILDAWAHVRDHEFDRFASLRRVDAPLRRERAAAIVGV
jgi:hypothetical protein